MLMTYLGHAMWLAEMGALRILFDPLLDGSHHGSVFEVHPPRELSVERLEPDFIVVTHAHPDHFDIASLRRLAELDADSVLLTSDRLVASVATRLGFRNVRALGSLDRVTLSSGELVTTPSHGTETEWGVVLQDQDVRVWNQVDSVMRNVDDVRGTLANVARALGQSGSSVNLAIVRWQPLLEIEAMLGEPAGFPFATYGELLDQVAAIGADTVIPGSAGSRHTGPHAFMNRLVYPLSEARFLEDARARGVARQCLAAEMGATYRVTSGGTELQGRSDLCAVSPNAPDDRVFRPFEIPALVDPDPEPAAERRNLERCERWVKTALAPALARRYPRWNAQRPLRLALELVGPTERLGFTLTVDERGTSITHEVCREYDVLNSIACSSLAAVIEGRQHFGQPLLGGLLRASVRAYLVERAGMRRLSIAPIFLYYALPYEESVRRATEHLLANA